MEKHMRNQCFFNGQTSLSKRSKRCEMVRGVNMLLAGDDNTCPDYALGYWPQAFTLPSPQDSHGIA